jgi:hypothetical protein
VTLDTNELIQRGEHELAAGSGSARKTLERARRKLLAARDVEGLERLRGLAARLDDGGDLAYAVEQNLRFLRRRAEARSGRPTVPPPTSRPDGPRDFLFGDPRRPRSLALALIAATALFPVAWVALLVVYGLGSNDPATQHGERVIVVLAAIPAAVGLAAAVLDWRGARRSYAPEARGALVGREGVLCATAVLGVFGAAAALGVVLWNSFV